MCSLRKTYLQWVGWGGWWSRRRRLAKEGRSVGGGEKSINTQVKVPTEDGTERNDVKERVDVRNEKMNMRTREMGEHMDVLLQPSSSGLPKGETSVQMSGLHVCAAGHDQSSGVKVDLCDLGSQCGLKQTPADVNLSTSTTPMCTNIPPNVVASPVLTTGDAAAVGWVVVPPQTTGQGRPVSGGREKVCQRPNSGARR